MRGPTGGGAAESRAPRPDMALSPPINRDELVERHRGLAIGLASRFAGKGESVIVTFRPVIFGSISTCAIPARSSRTFSINCMPNS